MIIQLGAELELLINTNNLQDKYRNILNDILVTTLQQSLQKTILYQNVLDRVNREQVGGVKRDEPVGDIRIRVVPKWIKFNATSKFVNLHYEVTISNGEETRSFFIKAYPGTTIGIRH